MSIILHSTFFQQPYVVSYYYDEENFVPSHSVPFTCQKRPQGIVSLSQQPIGHRLLANVSSYNINRLTEQRSQDASTMKTRDEKFFFLFNTCSAIFLFVFFKQLFGVYYQ
ncbi:hypothetical protein NECAME_03316 [Necator americanus]|uniref:Uncharacterized protein n=1 Tax=Necator americanus TaxID=51031 RepID=W2T7B8_NECAM|nr:hypothetical protein NECAME_03316 [Necator americanus]ETN76887.1 hypothetical protein NECAME_03316 [Necator americanus]